MMIKQVGLNKMLIRSKISEMDDFKLLSKGLK
ncbi:MAG: hypothetical protein XD67_0660 [Thermodesulfobacterium commune]|jgi:hypothetical protein|nr:MAG: hypothetical protein XD67_0660 [Thermodesulfobacterium commune]MDK2861412.1 hypothetical protein [Thermodesulfobacterium sp.]MDN5380157.1 hypothetical protein [Thermodesulfobacterium sp.]